MITITSKRAGFRRAGLAHPASPTTYPDDALTPRQLKLLQSEPMLVVHVTADPNTPDDSGGGGKKASGSGGKGATPPAGAADAKAGASGKGA